MTLLRALIPAAGRGVRLDRTGTPKPLVPIAGVPMIVRTLEQLEKAGVEEAVVVVGYESTQLIRTLTHHPRLKIRLKFAHAPAWQDQGIVGSLLAAKPLLEGHPVVIAMADHVFDPRLVQRICAEKPAASEIVALVDRNVAGVFDKAAAVKVSLSGDRITAMGRSLASYDAIDCGLFAAGPKLWDALEQAFKTSAKADVFDAVMLLAPKQQARTIDADGQPWDDVDTPADLIHTEMRLRKLRREQSVRPIAPLAPGQTAGKNYEFQTGARATTEVVVGRGIATDAGRLDLGIPVESASSPIFVFTDTTVNGLYGDKFVAGLEARGYLVHRIVMPDGEESKTIENYSRLVEHVLEKGIDERSVLVSLGGGAVCNVCGFVASTLYRGVGLIHVPTTLMAQCDAAISHKQALNGSRGKNLVGAYYPPIRVVVDVNFLATLEDWMIPDGLAEVVKHALGQDKAYLEELLAYSGDIRAPEFLERVIKRNIELKCELMAHDPKEHAAGMVLQYGHNVGHAVEYLSGYELSHGEAVAIGMMVAARTARILGGCTDEMVEIHERVIKRYDLPTTIPANMRISDILDALRYDKKYLSEGVRMALVAQPGELWQIDGDYSIPVTDDVLVPALEATLEKA